MCVILQDRCWLVHVLFVRIAKFQFLAHLLVDHLSRLVVFSLILLLYEFIIIIMSFSHQYWLMVFHWSLSDSTSPRVSRTRLSILAVFSNAVVWIVSTRPSTSKSSRPFNSPLVTVPNAPITIDTIVTFTFHRFSSKVEVLILLFTFLQIYSVVRRNSKVNNFADSLSFVDYYEVWSSGRD